MNGIPHSWDCTPQQAIQLQEQLAPQVITDQPLFLDRITLVAGVDVSVKDGISQAAIVVLTFPELAPVETATARMKTPFPYITSLLSFREGAVILKAHSRLTTQPDVYLFDGQGIAHPRHLGIASHIGLWWDAPTVGCGKTRLIGQHDRLGGPRGSYQPLSHNGAVIGYIVRTRTNVKPVYVSVGHRATMDTARDLVIACAPRYRLPEPIRAAHRAAGEG